MEGYLYPNWEARHMFWLLSVMALGVVDEVVVNVKVIRVLPVYSSIVTVSHLKTVICFQMTLRREENVLSKVLVVWAQVFQGIICGSSPNRKCIL